MKKGGTEGYEILVCSVFQHIVCFGGSKGEGLLRIGEKVRRGFRERGHGFRNLSNLSETFFLYIYHKARYVREEGNR